MTKNNDNNESMLDANEDVNLENQDTQDNQSTSEQLTQELNDYKDKYLRLLAERENDQKRVIKQLEETREYAIAKFAKELTGVVDIFHKAFTTVDLAEINDDKMKNFIVGIDLTKQELEKILGKFGVKALADNLVGEEFNPNFHEALMTKPDEAQKNGTIFQVFEQGYTLGDRLLRAAKVGIIKN
ncbi:nucleotide exchange factor GrpE [Rickettsiales bacterium LUAb2]